MSSNGVHPSDSLATRVARWRRCARRSSFGPPLRAGTPDGRGRPWRRRHWLGLWRVGLWRSVWRAGSSTVNISTCWTLTCRCAGLWRRAPARLPIPGARLQLIPGSGVSQRTTEVSAELYRDFDPDFDVRPPESRVRATEHDKCFDGITATCLSRDRPYVQIKGGGSDGALVSLRRLPAAAGVSTPPS